MEKDALISLGISSFLKERLFTVSDAFQIVVCSRCGIMTSSTTNCQMCKGDRLEKVNFPYASKLMVHELMAMGLKVNIKPKN